MTRIQLYLLFRRTEPFFTFQNDRNCYQLLHYVANDYLSLFLPPLSLKCKQTKNISICLCAIMRLSLLGLINAAKLGSEMEIRFLGKGFTFDKTRIRILCAILSLSSFQKIIEDCIGLEIKCIFSKIPFPSFPWMLPVWRQEYI